MSGRNNNPTQHSNAKADGGNGTSLVPRAYEEQYRRIVERAIASLVPNNNNNNDVGTTTQDSSSNDDDASVSRQVEREKPSTKNGQGGRSAAAANVSNNRIPESERPDASSLSSLHALQGLYQKAEQQQQRQPEQNHVGHARSHNQSGPPNNNLNGSDRPVRNESYTYGSNYGQTQQRTNTNPPGPQEQNGANDQLRILQNALSQAPSGSNVTPDVLGGLQLLLQLLPLLQNQNQQQQQQQAAAAPPLGVPAQEPQTQNFQATGQQVPDQQQSNQNNHQNTLAVQLISQLLQPSNTTAPVNQAPNAPNASFQTQQENRQEQNNSTDMQNLLLQNLLAKALGNNSGTATNAVQSQQDHGMALVPNRAQPKEPPGDVPMVVDTGGEQTTSEAALRNLLQMAFLVMAPGSTGQGQNSSGPQAAAYASPPANTRQPNPSKASFPAKQSRRTPTSRSLEAPDAAQSRGNQEESKGIPIFMDFDEEALTEYQCLLRKQIELFEATQEDVQASAQGRNNPILLGQVGIRCRYCASLPIKARPRGAVYYSRTIGGIYQVGQNMAKLHFCRTCNKIPEDIRAKLKYLQAVNRRASAGGKEYWSEGLRVLGVYEDGDVMRLRPSNS